ncbi:ribonucleoside-diphosphate reductase large subunit [Olea europaea subsp. europaea]|uniref:Ribonucleoside-diphosphate reductase n=1 Tax=Olea europaea subsp. europaea TaxID=158383 RepID=A0A8S0TG13_OLEEU|nr:ribonucleoside-diphosphate reductase large subunit [Olea europaea subsp. europaea]
MVNEATKLHHHQQFVVVKRDETLQNLNVDKIRTRLEIQSRGLGIDWERIVDPIVRGMYSGVATIQVDELIMRHAASLTLEHPNYSNLAARIALTKLYKSTPPKFSIAMFTLFEQGSISPTHASIVQQNAVSLNAAIVEERDLLFDYFGFQTLERSYLMRDKRNTIIERPQYLWMRVAIGIHGDDLDRALETYDGLSRGLFIHATPTLFHAATRKSQLASCFLLTIKDDSIEGIYDTLKETALISKMAGGVGLAVHSVRARGAPIANSGHSHGVVPMIKVFESTARYVDQGGNKRPGAFAVYIEPWHADIFDVLDLKKNTGVEQTRARDLFYALWIPNEFMKRVANNEMWSLMCPHQSPGLHHVYGANFERLYANYEATGKYVRRVHARDLWRAIVDAQIETGGPYMLYKDACNYKSNQRHLGTIQCSNLCAEIVEFSSSSETAVCNLASIALPQFVNESQRIFDFKSLGKTVAVVVRNLNKIIDLNYYPTVESATSNRKHRPIGIGVQGLADVFYALAMPYESLAAQRLNRRIFETIYFTALEESCRLARQFGPYESFNNSPTSRGLLQQDLWQQYALIMNQFQNVHSTENGKRDDCKLHENITNDEALTVPVEPEVDVEVYYDWTALRRNISRYGLRNSQLVAPMPTATTAQILGNTESFEPTTNNIYMRRVLSGECQIVNRFLHRDLERLGMWNKGVRNYLIAANGSVQKLNGIPDGMRELYKTCWEMKQKTLLDMAADRGAFVDQSQSLNVYFDTPTRNKVTAMHFHGWKLGLKTGMYYLRTKPAVNPVKFTVDQTLVNHVETCTLQNQTSYDECRACSS